jgi:endoglucanase
MNRRRFLWTQAGGFAGLGMLPILRADADESRRRPERGVSLAGAEFGTGQDFSNENLGVFGKDYTYNSERSVAYFCAQNIRRLRLPLRWERLQPRLGQPLDEAELERVKTFVAWARQHDGKVILDIHNYGRYIVRRNGKPREIIIDQRDGNEVRVTRHHFADLWRRLAQAFREEPAVHAYGLMNEPHDLGQSDWKAISQAAVDAIRREKDTRLILVAGDSWSNATRFATINGPRAWIADPARKVAYEAHCYFDADYSGHYAQSYSAELARDRRLETRGADRLRPFVRWCRDNRVHGFLGEFGIPAEPLWRPVLTRFLEELDQAGMEGCYWAAGEWWGDYPLSLQPKQNYQQAAPQLQVVSDK